MKIDELVGYVYRCVRCKSKFPVYCRVAKAAEYRRCIYCQTAYTEAPAAKRGRLIEREESATQSPQELAVAS